MNVIFGAGGFAKEVDFLLFENDEKYVTNYFSSNSLSPTLLNGIHVVKDEDVQDLLVTSNETVFGYIAVGMPSIRSLIFEKFKNTSVIKFPNAFAKQVVFDKRPNRVKLGYGNIICAGTVITTDITVGNFNNFHVNCTIGHDTKIGDFCSFLPGANISGNCSFGNNVFVGAGAVILQGLTICSDVIIGAGAVINRSIDEPGTYIGIPGKRIK